MDAHTTQSGVSLSTIIVAVLGSSLLTAGFTKAMEFYFSKINYKRDYFKLILERRLNASEALLNLLFESGNMIKDLDDQPYSPAFDTSKKTLMYFERLWEVQYHRMWLGYSVDKHYSDFLVYLNDSINKFNINTSALDSDCIIFSKAINTEQKKLGRILHLAIIKDLKHLYKIDNFFDEEIKKANP